MLVAGFLNLPDSFVVGAIVAILALFAVIMWSRRDSGMPGVFVLILLAVATVLIGYNTIVVVPQDKVSHVSTINGKYSQTLKQGVHFKLPWEKAKVYDDVIFTTTLDDDYFDGLPYEPAMSHLISIRRDFVFSELTNKDVTRSYVLAYACIRTLNALIKGGQTTLDKLECRFGDRTFLVLRY